MRIITFNRPDLLNPLDVESGSELIKALDMAEKSQKIRALVLTGKGKAFSAGGNVRLMAQGLSQGIRPSNFFREVAVLLNQSILALRKLPKPVVCAMTGVAAGGGIGWALACDLVVAAENSVFDPGYVRIALTPDGGTSTFITRLIGLKKASEFFLLGKPMNAAKALELGVINQTAKPDKVLETALALAQKLAQGPAEALAQTKRLLNQANLGDLAERLEDERKTIEHQADQPDFKEGITAFFEKRKPIFKD
ncbi:enoyl-CoA hydratase [Dethiosulfatarculus sandiegensis]|uniref:Enoyl-CoA hydratase n=1 Tax=Dethiosulfatarculus sandiegensis TaxID=1429043 RepID=A0A0D2JQ92_9BACT|nr:enoyl-CoA hydratase [Dethiosulfatarculus sandiegensis]